MQPDLFKETIINILQLASTNFLKAVVEADYTKEFYSREQNEELESSIVQLSEDLTQEVFGELIDLQVSEWMKKSHSTDFVWLFKFDTIRAKIHELANVEMLHINEQEAEKLLQRLGHQQ